jgi:hypothetical protein
MTSPFIKVLGLYEDKLLWTIKGCASKVFQAGYLLEKNEDLDEF